MTTPQAILHDLKYKLEDIRKAIDGEENDDEHIPGIYLMVIEINAEVTKMNEKMALLEEKMNLIIKLLSNQ